MVPSSQTDGRAWTIAEVEPLRGQPLDRLSRPRGPTRNAEVRHACRSIYTAVNASTARLALDHLADKWDSRYLALISAGHGGGAYIEVLSGETKWSV
jgi:hypothetical protein